MSADAQHAWRAGRFAVYRGHEYRYWTDPESGSAIGLIPEPDGPVPDDLPEAGAPGSGVVGYLVDRDRLDAMFESRWYFDRHGGQFEAVGGPGTDTISGNLVSPMSIDFVREHGLTLYEQYVAGGTFPIEEIANLHEERTDLLAAWRAKHGE